MRKQSTTLDTVAFITARLAFGMESVGEGCVIIGEAGKGTRPVIHLLTSFVIKCTIKQSFIEFTKSTAQPTNYRTDIQLWLGLFVMVCVCAHGTNFGTENAHTKHESHN